jgi:hypothetical protein
MAKPFRRVADSAADAGRLADASSAMAIASWQESFISRNLSQSVQSAV